jgi:hypothetical protein
LTVAKAEFSRPLGPQWLVIYAIGGETWRRRRARCGTHRHAAKASGAWTTVSSVARLRHQRWRRRGARH